MVTAFTEGFRIAIDKEHNRGLAAPGITTQSTKAAESLLVNTLFLKRGGGISLYEMRNQLIQFKRFSDKDTNFLRYR